MVLVAPNAVFGGIGKIDKREYVDWNTEPYNNIVAICSGTGCGTGEFINHKHILTNKHVAECCGINGQNECVVSTSDGEKVFAKVVATGNGLKDCKYNHKRHINSGLDWSIIEVLDRDFIKKRKDNNQKGWELQPLLVSNIFLKRAGFGGLKVLNDDDIKNIKQAYVEFLINDKDQDSDEASHHVDLFGAELGQYGSIYDYYKKGEYKGFIDAFKKNTGKDFIEEYLDDFWNIKAIFNCNIIENRGSRISHTCDGWNGDSGSAILDYNNKIVGLHNSGFADIGSQFAPGTNFAVPVSGIVTAISNLNVDDDSEVSPEPIIKPPFLPVDPSEPSLRDIGESCLIGDLPPHAIEGKYIKSGGKKSECNNGGHCSCAATVCESGYYLVVNAKGWSQGWCYTRRCPSGQHLNIINKTKTDTKCVDD